MILPQDVLGDPQAVHDRFVATMYAMGERFDAVVAKGVMFRSKTNYAGVANLDVVSDADETLQEEFLAEFPGDTGWGVIAEEKNLQIAPKLVTNFGPVVVTIDPVDGTKQLERVLADPTGRRHGVTSMVAVKVGTHVVAAYILDLFTKELFFVKPAHGGVVFKRVNGVEKALSLSANAPQSLAASTLLLHSPLSDHPHLAAWLNSKAMPVFGGVVIAEYSIGLTLMEVVRGNVAAAVRRPGGYFTPWDDTPIIGMCRAAGIRTFWIEPGGVFQEFVLTPPTAVTKRDRGVLYVPARFIEQLSQVAVVRLLSA